MINIRPYTQFILTVSLIMVMLFGCNKEDEPLKDSELKSFSSLQVGDDSLFIGQITDIWAVYEGKGVTFTWEATAGDILGSGDTIQYLASFCALGLNTITCKAVAENTSITRSVNIYVE